MSPAVAELNIGVGPSWGEACGDMLEAMARIAPSQPNEAMARIAPPEKVPFSLDPSCRIKFFRERLFGRRFEIVFED
jgi:hypothetical protein